MTGSAKYQMEDQTKSDDLNLKSFLDRTVDTMTHSLPGSGTSPGLR